MEERDDYDDDYDDEEPYDSDDEEEYNEEEPYDYDEENPIQKISYKIVPTFELSKQPTIHGVITDCRLRIVFKDGRVLNVGCDWEGYTAVLKKEVNKQLTQKIVEKINNLLKERIVDELYEHIWILPREFVGEFIP